MAIWNPLLDVRSDSFTAFCVLTNTDMFLTTSNASSDGTTTSFIGT